MKKSTLTLITGCIMLALVSCSTANTESSKAITWKEADLSLYNHSGEEELYLTEKTHEIKLSTGEGLKTNRGEKIGDNAKKVLEKYDLTDFKFEFSSNHYFNPTLSKNAFVQTQQVERHYEKKSPSEMLNYLDELPNFDGHFYYLVKLYEYNKKLYTESNAPDELDNSEHCYWIFYYIENERISDIVINLWK